MTAAQAPRVLRRRAQPPTLANLVAGARARADLTLTGLGQHMGLAVSFLHDVEHGRRPLDPRHWRKLRGALPELSLRALALGSLVVGKVEIDARDLTPRQRAKLAAELEARARRPARRTA